ncbi:glycosyltransferase [Sodalinema gerasimenkoae]|uniref:glycosyltransferase n=1 Tax=Sodalinema gerasimenkoae TaxID=2862348 RepID=UPI0013581964|nr:glycosyltransferase [Sodalinema gerasimenkoae]
MSSPLVSLITPCYNDKRYIRQALESVQQSKYANIEHFVIDDGSTDGTADYLEELRSQFSFYLVKSAKHVGVAAARNLAISLSKGKYILPLDSDNYFDPGYIETLVNQAEQLPEKYCPLYPTMVLFGDASNTIPAQPWSVDKLFKSPFIHVNSLFTRKAFDAAGGFDPNLGLFEDYDLFIAMALKGFVGYPMPGVKLHYRIRKDGLVDHFNQRGGETQTQRCRRYIFRKRQAQLERLKLDSHPQVSIHLQGISRKLVHESLSTRLLHLIPPDANQVVEIGCQTGEMGEAYKRINPHGTYIGIDEQLEQLNSAKSRLDQVFQTPLSQIANLAIAPGSIDCVVISRNLAQLAEPVKLLQTIRLWLKHHGQVICAVPNPHYWRAILGLLQGKHQDTLDVDDVQKIFTAANLQLFEMERYGDVTEESKAFQEKLKPVLDAYQIPLPNYEKRNQTEAYLVRAWKGEQLLKRLFVQTVMISTMASDQVRVYQPDRCIRTIPGVRTDAQLYNVRLNAALSGEEKVFIWQRSRLTKADAVSKQRQLIEAGYLIVVEMDDDPRFWPEHIKEDFITYRSCHCIQTSTEPLAEFLRQFNPYVKVFPNQLPELPPAREYRQDGRMTVFFGALNRERDWQPLVDRINRVLEPLGDRVQVQVVHDQKFFQALETPHKQFEPTCSYRRYHELLREADLALLPLNYTEFNSMKSDLKFIECAGQGVTVLASPTVYAASVQEGQTGVIYETLDQFEEKFRRLVTDTSWRRQLAQNAYNWVRDQRLLSLHYRERVAWYWQMRSRLPELNEALRQRVPDIFR